MTFEEFVEMCLQRSVHIATTKYIAVQVTASGIQAKELLHEKIDEGERFALDCTYCGKRLNEYSKLKSVEQILKGDEEAARKHWEEFHKE